MPYYSNLNYGGYYIPLDLKKYIIKNNEGKILTYNNFLQGEIFKSKRNFYEGLDHYISEGGVLFPSHMDSALHKVYPSLPIFYALSRHLYDCNIHVNLQMFGRLWKALREQADYYVYVHKTIKIPFFLVIKYTTYDKLESAEKLLQPLKIRLFNKQSKCENDLYIANNGNIKNGYVFIRKSKIKYNTRAFEKMLLKGKRKEY